MKRKPILLTLLALLIVVCSAIAWIWNKSGKKVEDEAGIVLNVDKLCLDFTNNEIMADSLYLNKAIQMKGRLTELSTNLDGGTMIVFAASNNIDDVECTLREAVSDLKVGSTIIVKGFCTGKTMTGVTLTDCIIVP